MALQYDEIFSFNSNLTLPLPDKIVESIPQVSNEQSRRSVVWFRNDLRTIDHAPLLEASLFSNTATLNPCMKSCDNGFVIGLFIYNLHDFNFHDWGLPKLDFLHRNLIDLRESLWNKYKIPLLVLQLDDINLSYAYSTDPSIHDSNIDGYRISKRRRVDACLSSTERRIKFSDEFYKFCKAFCISAVYCHSEMGIDENERDSAIVNHFISKEKEFKISCYFNYSDQSLLPLGSICSKSKGEPFKKFTLFRTAWAIALLDIVKEFKHTSKENQRASNSCVNLPWAHYVGEILANSFDISFLDNLRSMSLASMEYLLVTKLKNSTWISEWPAGEEFIIKSLIAWFSKSLHEYSVQRDFPSSENGTSRLSPYLALGIICVRTVTRALDEETVGIFTILSEMSSKTPSIRLLGAVTYLTELCWREFYRNILYSFPKVFLLF